MEDVLKLQEDYQYFFISSTLYTQCLRVRTQLSCYCFGLLWVTLCMFFILNGQHNSLRSGVHFLSAKLPGNLTIWRFVFVFFLWQITLRGLSFLVMVIKRIGNPQSSFIPNSEREQSHQISKTILNATFNQKIIWL